MPRVPQAPPPGVVRNATPEATPGRWWDVDHIRFRGNQLLPIGGNVALPNCVTPNQPDESSPPVLVPDWPRDVLTWHDNQHVRWAAFGTDARLYAFCFSLQMLYDITPAGVGRLAKPGALVGYGAGYYGDDTYGTARLASDIGVQDIAATMGDIWSLDTFGEDLLIVPTQDGRLFRWTPPNPPPPTGSPPLPMLVANAPTQNRGVVVTDQRHVVLIGAGGDPRNVAWSAQEDPNTWIPNVDNLAGSKLLQTQSYAMTAKKIYDGVLIFTANDVHKMSYAGPPYAYGIVQIGAGCGPLSLRAVVAIGSTVAWPGLQNFWSYAGNVQPLSCDVQDWFFSLVNRQMVGRVFGSPNPAFSELWWDWPDEGSSECNRYLALNYADGNKPWTIGTRNRTAADPSGTMDYPVLGGYLVNQQGSLFLHEYGWTNNGQPRAVSGGIYAESGSIVLGEGDKRFHVKQLVFDAPGLPPPLGYRFYVREQPYADGQNREWQTGLYTQITGGLMDVRFSGRTIRMRMEATADYSFSVGRPRLDIRQGGRR